MKTPLLAALLLLPITLCAGPFRVLYGDADNPDAPSLTLPAGRTMILKTFVQTPTVETPAGARSTLTVSAIGRPGIIVTLCKARNPDEIAPNDSIIVGPAFIRIEMPAKSKVMLVYELR